MPNTFWSAAGYSHLGQKRTKNDDCYVIGPFVEREHLTALQMATHSRVACDYGLLVAVADGLGGYAGGALASQTVLDAFAAHFAAYKRDDNCAAQLERFGDIANRALTRALGANEEFSQAGTTLVGLCFLPMGELFVFHCGDSRAIRFVGGVGCPLTCDHAAPSGGLTRSFGLVGDTRLEVASLHWQLGDTFLLCSDGLHGENRGLDLQTLSETLRENENVPVAELTSYLVQEAVERDGRDNVTGIIVRVGAS
ncbi:hypothetical protein EON83_12720 [bacterium]|nr:MAG: hypothetical protein EON83_12720 [bacterium]